MSSPSSMRNSVLDQSGHLHSRGSNNVRKECSEWSAVSCTNDRTGGVQVFNCQVLNLQGGVGMKSRERHSLRKQNQAAEEKQLQQPDAPSPPPGLPWPPLGRQRSSTPVETHNLGKRSRQLGEEPTGNPGQQHESPLVKRPRMVEENDGQAETEYYRPDWTVLPTDSGLNDVGVSTQLCNAILLPADYDLIADKFPTFEEHVAGARTRCLEALAFVTALEQRMDFWRQQMARNVMVREAGDGEDGGNR